MSGGAAGDVWVHRGGEVEGDRGEDHGSGRRQRHDLGIRLPGVASRSRSRLVVVQLWVAGGSAAEKSLGWWLPGATAGAGEGGALDAGRGAG